MKKTFIWGHRGSGFRNYNDDHDYIVENSMKSFQYAIKKGVDGIKTEARLSKDHMFPSETLGKWSYESN